MSQARIQKVLARAGIASRRQAEELIRAGRVKVSGRVVTELGSVADPRTCRIEVDGRRIMPEPLVYVALHKPRGVMCTMRDPQGRPCIADYVKQVGVRVVPVGRLDFNTSGILLLTNDGDLSAALQHPRKAVPRVYVAKVRGEVTDAALARWRERIVIDGRAIQPAEVKRLRIEGGKTWLELTLREGRNQQVRRLGEAAGFPVMRLARLSHAGVTSAGLRPGRWRHLTVDELKELRRSYGVPKRVKSAVFGPERTSPRPGAAPRRAPGGVPKRRKSTVPGPRRMAPQQGPAIGSGEGSPDRGATSSPRAPRRPQRRSSRRRT